MRHELGLLSNIGPGSPIFTSILFPISLLRAPTGPFTLKNQDTSRTLVSVSMVVCFSLQANVADSSSSDFHADVVMKPVTCMFSCRS